MNKLKWEKIECEGGEEMARAVVPGGHLYKISEWVSRTHPNGDFNEWQTSMCFVPTPFMQFDECTAIPPSPDHQR